MKILFVCRGNVGRSQIAEALFNINSSTHQATSVGTKVFDKDGVSVEGEKLSEREGAKHIISTMDELGIDVRMARRNQITKESTLEANIIVSMSEEETLPEYLKENDKVRYWNIEDPKNKTIEEVRVTRERIDQLVNELLEEIGR